LNAIDELNTIEEPVGPPRTARLTRRRVFQWIFLGIFLLLLGLLVRIFTPFLTPILWAIILTQVTYPVYRRVYAAAQGRRQLAAWIMTLSVMLLAVVPALYVILIGVQQSLDAYEEATDWIKGGGLQEVGVAISQLPAVGTLGQELIGRFIVSHGQFETSLLEGGKAMSGFLAAQGAGLIKNALIFGTDFLVMLFTLFFLFRDGDRLYARLYRAIPLEDDHKTKMFERLDRTITAVVRGTMVTALSQGVVAGTAYWLLDVPFPIFWGALTALVALLPFGGTSLVWGPVVMYLIGSGFLWKGLIMLGVGLGLVGLMDNLLYPVLVGAGARLPVLFLFFASLGGMVWLGFLGLFLGPILLAVVYEAFKIYEEEFEVDSPADLILPPNAAPTA
jgi:predicted PurR-regulated permease PerM